MPPHKALSQVRAKLIAVVCLQVGSGAELAEMKRRAGLLKRVCRQRTQAAWKEWRHSMEAQRHASLASHLQLLHQDHAALAQGQQQVRHLQAQAQQLGQSLRAEKNALRAQREVRCRPALHNQDNGSYDEANKDT